MKIVHPIIGFLIFRIDWKKLLPIGAIITITFALLQTKMLPYQLMTHNSSLPNTNHFDANLESQITPLIRDKQFEAIKVDPEILLNSSSQLIQPVSVVQEKVKVNQRKNHTDVVKPNISMKPSPPFSLSASERRHKRYLRDIKMLSPYEALVYAKKEVDTFSVGIDGHDPNLYAPLFKNVSVFERVKQLTIIETTWIENGGIRQLIKNLSEWMIHTDGTLLLAAFCLSYELMELILKVYIYQDGKRPIFHYPYLRGIYSSEGWFMKFMEASKQFVTKDPEKAHLFYLPYSARQLQRALFVPNSHNIKPLSFFLRDYVNKLASKYAFWNRTRGSDHFLVACHDWGPYTLKEHEELTKNTIKALCNADTSEGVFLAGKDVSLPETTIQNPRRPLRNIGGKKISQRPILAFFAGRMHGRVRPMLLKHWANKDEKMIISGLMSSKTSQKMSYSLHMKSSKYCICPMGFEVNSPRIVEAIYYECVPVIIADNFVPPLNEVLDWNAFSVIVTENDIPKLKEILEAISMKKYLTMQYNVKMLQRHFYWNRSPVKFDMFHMILHSIWFSRLNQIQIPISSS